MARLSRIISLLLIVVMAMTFFACGKAGDGPEQTTKASKSASEKNSIVSVPLAYEPLEIDEDDFEDGEFSWQRVYMGFASVEREYPALTGALAKLNTKLDEDANKALEKMKADAEEAKTTYGIAFFPGEIYSHSRILARRADTNVVSLVRVTDSYNATSNPMSVVDTYNIDVQTGQRLLEDDVFPVFKGLIPKIAKSLTVKYPDVTFSETGVEKSIRALCEAGEIRFSIDYQGITFYFNPGTVASEEDGILTVSYTYEKLGNDVVVKFTSIPETYSYCFTKDLPNYAGVSFELKNEYMLGYFEGMTLEFDGTKQELKDFMCTNYALYFVHMGSGDYVYVDNDGEDGYGGLYIYSLGAKNIYETKYLDKVSLSATALGDSEPCYAELFTCPSRFILGTRCDMLATSVAKNKYQVGSDGVPKLLNKENQYVIDSTRQYTLRTDVRDAEGVLIRSGTKFNFISTDFDDIVVFVTEDGFEHTFSYSELNVSRTVDGIEYAG